MGRICRIEMSETTETNPRNDAETTPVTETERTHVALNRVLNLSIFFVGAGTYAAIGLGLRKMALFDALGLTYFAVGAAVGAMGLLLWLVTR